ncbi:MAG: nitrate reductase molybdenum cofactor assembly chaperone [Gammaproteobacteria bacterium]
MRSPDSASANRALVQLGQLLQYPDENLAAAVREVREGIGPIFHAAGEELASFEAFVHAHDFADWKQTYTEAFDLDPLFKIYIGYHLFGETYKRSHFLVKLNEHYREHGYECSPELPDHLAVALRFLPHCDHEAFRDGLIREGIVPCVKRMLGKSPTTEEERSEQEGTGPQSLEDAIRVEQLKFYSLAEIQASRHPDAFGQGVVTAGLNETQSAAGSSFGVESIEGSDPDRYSCSPCPLAKGPASMTADLGTQLKGVPEHEKERDMQKIEVRKGEEQRLSHPYAHLLFAVEQVLEVVA